MNENLAKQAELEKLSRLLAVDQTRLSYLRKLPAATIAELVGKISDTLYDEGEERFRRLAKLSTFAPTGLAVSFAQHLLGPFTTAMVAVNVSPDKAIELAGHLPPGFLAEVSLHLDPRRARAIIAKLPDDLVVGVAHELRARSEHVTLGRFVGYVSHAAIVRATEPATPSELLRTAFFVEAVDRFDEIISALSDDRLHHVISTAADEDLWLEALSILDAVGDANRKRIADLAGALDVQTLTSMAEAADDQGVLDVVLPLVAAMNADNRRRIAGLEYLHRPDVIDRVVATAYRANLRQELRSIVEFLPEDARNAVEGAKNRITAETQPPQR